MPEEKMIKEAVRQTYTAIAEQSGSCCSCGYGCSDPTETAKQLGYSIDELDSIPSESNMGLGCGSPVAQVGLEEGETILDLGSGGGIDVFLAAKKIGPSGKAIGVDMNEAMVKKARKSAVEYGYKNVDFRLGEIENIPVESSTVDAVISNCVINLSTDKDRVFRETYRVLKTGGRITVSDIVTNDELPKEVRDDLASWASCVGGASLKNKYLDLIHNAGFKNIEILTESIYSSENPLIDGKISSITVKAYKR